MKQITFRPIRKDKKTGKMIVASYMQWRKVWTANYGKCELTIVNEYKGVNPDDFVYNHKGDQLFWFNHKDPDALPKNYANIERTCELLGIEEEVFAGEEWKLTEPLTQGFHWSVRGFDCDGIPNFSHCDANYCTQFDDMEQFEPLTVGMVVLWFGWILCRLENTTLKY